MPMGMAFVVGFYEQVSVWLAEEAEKMYLGDRFVSRAQKFTVTAQTGINKTIMNAAAHT